MPDRSTMRFESDAASAHDAGAAPLSAARAKVIRALHRKKERQAEGAFLAEGERLLDELSRAPARVRFVFATGERLAWLAERFPETLRFSMQERQIDLFATDSPQGVGAVVDIPEPPTLGQLLEEPGPILMLDGISDPGNAGTIVRTAEWFGIHRVIFGAGSVDAYNPKVVRATMGAIFTTSVIEGIPSEMVLSAGLPVVALDGRGSERLGEMELPRHAIYVVGSEAHGISPAIAAEARLVAIPGAGSVESLNAGIAAGILCYELARLHQRS